MRYVKGALVLAGVAVSATSLWGCGGSNVCVAGVGDCDHIWQTHRQTQQKLSAITIKIKPAQSWVAVSGNLPLNVSGGQPPYTYSVVSPTTGDVGQFTDDGTYYAPRSIPKSPYPITIRVTDKTGNWQNFTLQVQNSHWWQNSH